MTDTSSSNRNRNDDIPTTTTDSGGAQHAQRQRRQWLLGQRKIAMLGFIILFVGGVQLWHKPVELKNFAIAGSGADGWIDWAVNSSTALLITSSSNSTAGGFVGNALLSSFGREMEETDASTSKLGSGDEEGKPPYRPHIVFVIMDDLGSHDLGFHGTGESLPRRSLTAAAAAASNAIALASSSF